jgi:hypothetical protein
MATESKTVYQPRLPVRPGQTHSYQSAHGIKVVTVDPAKQRAEIKAANRAGTAKRGAISTGEDE